MNSFLQDLWYTYELQRFRSQDAEERELLSLMEKAVFGRGRGSQNQATVRLLDEKIEIEACRLAHDGIGGFAKELRIRRIKIVFV